MFTRIIHPHPHLFFEETPPGEPLLLLAAVEPERIRPLAEASAEEKEPLPALKLLPVALSRSRGPEMPSLVSAHLTSVDGFKKLIRRLP